ncbi:unnamed protein product [Prunus armeniaca]|uniref:Uncharacterized protein n=1 Tax=Prunus armeniaca TaxID=36596 RepID=A0A6J5TKN0_PRUAR|nr:unnamed protein product [Prunus armeniaca]
MNDIYSLKPDHLPKVAAALSKTGVVINLKILINGKDLNIAIAEDVAATPNAPKAPKTLKAAPIKLKIMMNGKDLELDHTLEAELEHPPEVAVAPSKAGAAINLKILINGKDLNTTIAEDIVATP